MKRLTLLTLTVLGLAAVTLAQGRPGEPVAGGWQERADSLLADTSLRFAVILDVMRPVRGNDSILAYLLAGARARGHLPAQAFAVNHQSVNQRRVSNYGPALDLAVEAERLAVLARDTLARMVALNSQGVIYRRLDRIIEALDVHQRALELASEIANPDFGSLQAYAIALNSKGQIHLSLGEDSLAAESFRRSLTVDTRNGNRLGLAINNGNLARIFEQADQLDSALHYYTKAITYNEEIDSKLGLAICYTGLSEVMRKRGRDALALDYARRAVPLADAYGDDTYIASAELQLGRVLSERSAYPEAEIHLARALAVAESRGLLDEESRTHYALATLAERRGQHAAALGHYREAHDIERAINNDKNRRYVTAVNARWETEQKALQIEELARENELVRLRADRNTRFAIAGITALSLLAILLGVLYRQRRLVLQRDIAQLEQQRMASLMNPHFLFNALNSIKADMIGERNRSAITLLGTFATYMRRILNSSVDEAATLAEELKSAQLYFDIENSRLARSVTFDLSIDPQIDLDEVMVPPLILQPFIENALLHGLRGKDGDKSLKVEVSQREHDSVEVAIRDNGIGRAASAERNSASRSARKSYGMDITQRRLDHFSRRRGRKAGEIVVNDLRGEGGEAAGTEVVLRLRV